MATPATDAHEFEIVHDTREGPGSYTFEIPPDGRTRSMALRFEPAQETLGCPGVGHTITVRDPNGAVFAVERAPLSTAPACDNVGEPGAARLAPGTWSVEFRGRALAHGVLTVR